VAFSFPHHISYFNELIPKSRRLYWLGDSNFDIGQDTKRLAETAREKGWNHIKLAYFGNVDPSLYAMKWDYWTQKDLSGPQPGWIYAVNAAFLQLGPAFIPQAPAILNSWITRHPADGMAGDTWYYFEIPGQISLNDHSPSLASAPLFDYYRRFYSFEPATKVQAK
jgi:hypothetical protein